MAKEIVNIYGFSIRENTLYQVAEKLDPDAPDGFIEYETSKILQNNIYDTEPGAIWNPTLGVWDTGLFEESLFLKQAFPDTTLRQKALNELDTHIIKPLEKLKHNFFDNKESNDSFWNTYSIKIKNSKIFNTNDPEQLFQLYILVLSKRLTPKEITSHPEFKNSQYVIEDKEDKTNKETEKVAREMRANELFILNKASNKEHLGVLLDFAGMRGVTTTTSDDTLMVAFKNFLNDKGQGVQNTLNFIKVAEMSSKKDMEMLYIFGKLKELSKIGIVKHKPDGIYLDDSYLGNSFKVAAEEVNKTKELKIKFNEASASLEQ